jgi:FMN phosphatase YigB (HAD superfamily)
MKTIVWDVDDVLNDFTRRWFEGAWLPAHPDCALRYEQLSENPPHALLHASKSEYLASLDAFRQSALAEDLTPLGPVFDWFCEHGHRSQHVAITATPLRAAPRSAAWVMRHFGRWIRSFHLMPSPREGERLPVYDRSKGELLGRWPHVDVFIDDDPANLASAEAAGIKSLPMPRPWNSCQATLSETLEHLTQLVQN